VTDRDVAAAMAIELSGKGGPRVFREMMKNVLQKQLI